MAQLRVLASAEVPPDRLAALRALVDDAFAAADPVDAFGRPDEAFGDDDWAHALGGWHVVLEDPPGVPVAHAAVVPRLLEVGGRPLRAGYVEAVATAPGRQGEGLGSRAMAAVADLVGERFELGALSTGRHAFYARAGWERWRGPTFVRHGGRLVRTEHEDDGIMVLRRGPGAGLDLTAPLTCEARDGDDW